MRSSVLPLLTVLSLPAFAQIPNPGFENWAPSGAGYDDPVGWRTVNLATYPQLSCEQGTVSAPEGGSYAILTTRTVSGFIVPGTMFAGTADNVAFPYAQRPDALTGQWQYYVQGGDFGLIVVTLSRWNEDLGQTEGIGTGVTYFSGAIPQWTPFSVPITYLSPETPDSAMIQFSSSQGTTTGSTLWVDDLAFDGATNVAEVNAPAELLIVTTSGELRINARTAMRQLSITDMSGRVVAQAAGGSSCLVLAPLPPGPYVARAQLVDGRVTVRTFASY